MSLVTASPPWRSAPSPAPVSQLGCFWFLPIAQWPAQRIEENIFRAERVPRPQRFQQKVWSGAEGERGHLEGGL